MTPVPENHVAVHLKPIPGDRSMAGKTIDTSWRRQPPIVVEKSLLPLNQRATSGDTSSGGAGDSFVVPSKKRRVDTGSDATSAYGVHRYDMAAPHKPSGSNEITGTVTSEQAPLQQQKHMHGAIRSRGVRSTRRLFSHALAAAAYDDGAMEEAETSAAGAARAKKNRKTSTTNRNRNRNKRSREAAVTSAHRPLHPGAGLSGRLEALGVVATDAQFVCMKTLHNSDVSRNQNRLLFSCKPEFLASHPITALLGEKDTYFVFEHEHGLRVSAYDGEGREFGMKLRYLDSNGGYRLIGAWGSCVEKNELTQPVEDGRRVHVELWAFRSPELPEQPLLNDRDRQNMVEGLEGDPNGKLGLLFLPYVDDGEGAEEDVERAPPPTVHETTKRRASAKAPPPTVHDTTKRRASAKAPREEWRLAEDRAVRASRGKKAVERQVTFGEMVVEHGKEMAHSIAALIKLSYCAVVRPSFR